ncbi:hypothetical protein PSHT_09473 [Puccinia striiformis]|uniref:Uncharacterized protein n=1 Tax=Puccinia striiformis TaxID=27350 RepID=A0A2S4VGA4_9BASI|nr:hypothetical protein PSHT_09473 [Puccinia striiformis]
MHSSSQDGHQEVPTLNFRRRKASGPSRPFPPGFTPVTQVSPCTPRSIKDSCPIFLPPTLRSPLPPSNGGMAMEKQQARVHRLVKIPPSPQAQPSQRNQARLLPSIKRICRITRPSQRPPDHSAFSPSSASAAQDSSEHGTPHNGPAMSKHITTRLRSLSQHSSIISRPKLRDLQPSPSLECLYRNTGDSYRYGSVSPQMKPKAKPGLPRTSSIPTNISTPSVDRSAHSLLERRTKPVQPEKNWNSRKNNPPEFSCPRRSARAPSTPRMAQVGQTPTSYIHFNSSGSHQMETTQGINSSKKLPDYVLNNWTDWRREILLD